MQIASWDISRFAVCVSHLSSQDNVLLLSQTQSNAPKQSQGSPSTCRTLCESFALLEKENGKVNIKKTQEDTR